MKRKILLLTICTSLMLVGCSKDKNDTTEDDLNSEINNIEESSHISTDKDGNTVIADNGEDEEDVKIEVVTSSEESQSASDECNGAYVSLEKLTENKTDYLSQDEWCAENNFDEIGYVYDGYSYVVGEQTYTLYVNDDFYGNSIKIDNSNSTFYSADIEDLYSGDTSDLEIQYALMNDGIIYVELSYNGYSADNPDSSFIVAYDPASDAVLWQSDYLVANCHNFLIEGNTIITGYGFTAEPDYLYLLDKNSGKVVEKIAVNSAPDQMEVRDDILYLCTYNTAYTFKVNK